MIGVPVIVYLPRPMEGMGRLQFSYLFTELPVPPQATAVVGTFQCALYIYHSEHDGLIFRGYHIIFTGSLLFNLCAFPFFPDGGMCGRHS